MIRLVVGLGNPGVEYKQTRHNAGFVFLDVLAGLDGWLVDKRFNGWIKTYPATDRQLILLKPNTFMNRSGVSVAALQKFYRISADETLIVHDEIDLADGCVRLKKGGGHGGHNGVRDVIAQTGSRDFYRLRIGVGRPVGHESVSDFVLSKWSSSDYELLLVRCRSVIDGLDKVLVGDAEGFNSFCSASS